MEQHEVVRRASEAVKSAFVTAFGRAWNELLSGSEERVRKAYGGNGSWTALLFGPESGVHPTKSSSSFLFPLVARHLKEINTTEITQIRQQDYTVDMSFVGGKCCLGEDRGMGYASRQLVLIEHENAPETADEEFYKLLFRVADLKVLAFPDWSRSRLEQGRASPGTNAILRFREIAEQARPHAQDENLIVLIAQRDDESSVPTWSWVESPWLDERQPIG